MKAIFIKKQEGVSPNPLLHYGRSKGSEVPLKHEWRSSLEDCLRPTQPDHHYLCFLFFPFAFFKPEVIIFI
jgi:hypothetical protein